MTKIGLIVNPIAGLGGKLGFKGSDNLDAKKYLANSLINPDVASRTKLALEGLSKQDNIHLYVGSGSLGESLAKDYFSSYVTVGFANEYTTRLDTIATAVEMQKLGVDILIFVGGDGTARDIYSAIGSNLLTIGIPAGVKMYSPVFLTNPKHLGILIKRITTNQMQVEQLEVLDIDESRYSKGELVTKLYGYLLVPTDKSLVQGKKIGGLSYAKNTLTEISSCVINDMKNNDEVYIVGPGSTTMFLKNQLSNEGSLLGVDLFYHGKLIKKDVCEADILEILEKKRGKIVVTVLSGQGFIFGRGNAQISAKVLSIVGKDNITIIATKDKLLSLPSYKLFIDTGDSLVDEMLRGVYRVITGINEEVAILAV